MLHSKKLKANKITSYELAKSPGLVEDGCKMDLD